MSGSRSSSPAPGWPRPPSTGTSARRRSSHWPAWTAAGSSAALPSTPAARHTDAPGPGLLAVFDEWFRQGPAQAGSLLHVMVEMGPGSPLGQAGIARLARIRDQLAALACEAGLADPEGFARSCQILLHGSVVAAAEGDRHAPERARHLAALLLAESSPQRVPIRAAS